MPKTVLVTGATGLLGRQVVKAFSEADWTVQGTGYSRARPPAILKLDLSNKEDVEKVLEDVKPDVLVHCAAERFPDKCEADPEGTKRLNIHATSFLAKQAASRGILMIYISTDYVFDGKPGAAPYTADAKTCPPNFYGETKRDGEDAILKEAGSLGVVLRVPILYGSGENKESSVNSLMDAVWNTAGKDKIDMDHWAVRYPTNTEDVARVLKDIAEKYTTTDPATLPRLLQFSSEDAATKYEMCQRLGSVLGLPVDHVVGNDSNDPNATVIRPYDCHLSTKELKDIGINVSTMDFTAWWKRELGAFKK